MLAFPCNQFANQEPDSNEQILEFATSKYGVTFPMFAKIEVNGDGADPLYEWLKEEQPGEGDRSDIGWNFEKFVLNKKGEVIGRFKSGVLPTDAKVRELIDKALAEG